MSKTKYKNGKRVDKGRKKRTREYDYPMNTGVHKWRIGLVLGILAALVVMGVVVVPLLMGQTYDNESSFKKFAKKYVESNRTHEVGKSTLEYAYGTPDSYAFDLPITDSEALNQTIADEWQQEQGAFSLGSVNFEEGDKGALLMGYDSYETPYDAFSVAVHYWHYETQDGEATMVERVKPYMASTINGAVLPPVAVFSGDHTTVFKEKAKAYLEDNYEKSLTEDYESKILEAAGNYLITNEGVVFYFDAGTVADAKEGAISLTIPYEDFDGLVRDDIGKRVVDPNRPMVAITYDDGPSAETTPELLDLYEKYGAVCTFFELGQNVENTKDADKILKRELELGCEIGTHSYSHPNLYELSDAKVKEQADKSIAAIEKASGQKPTIFRPPYGNGSDKICEIFGLCGVNWNIDTMDWSSKNADSVIRSVRNDTDLDGDIILMHSIYPSTVEASKVLVPELLDQGYQLVTVSELLQYKYGYNPIPAKYLGYEFDKEQ